MTDAARACEPTKAEITPADILAQLRRDLYDKEVQSAATYSYLWVADQMGHFGLGLVIVFALSWPLGLFLGRSAFAWAAAGGCVLVCAWELSVFRPYAGLATGLFRSDAAMLAADSTIAATYMVLGVLTGFAWTKAMPWPPLATLGAAVIAVALAPHWLRQKIVWQKAGMPFLFRLSDYPPSIAKTAALALQQRMDDAVAANARGAWPSAPGPAFVIHGPLRAGKASLACGIGTEGAFGGLKVRYTTFDKLAQMAFSDGDDSGPANIGYWPWTESQVLIIDDIDTDSTSEKGEYRDLEEFADILERQFGARRQCLGRRISVWVLGEKPGDELGRWTDEIVKVCSEGGTPELFVIRCAPPASLGASSDAT